jgi:DNA-binding transcriptional LysR family regulator
MAIDAAEAGLGIAITREAQVADVLKSGRLVAPFRRDLLRGEGCYLMATPENYDEPHLAAFRAWLLEEATREVEPTATKLKNARADA